MPSIGQLAQTYERQLMDLVQSTIPRFTRVVEQRVGDFLKHNNLTHVSRDIEVLYFSMWVAGNCSRSQREKLTTEVARARLDAGRCVRRGNGGWWVFLF